METWCYKFKSMGPTHSETEHHQNFWVWNRESSVAGPCTDTHGSCLKYTKLPESFQQDPFIEKLGERYHCWEHLGVRSFVPEVSEVIVRSQHSQKPPPKQILFSYKSKVPNLNICSLSSRSWLREESPCVSQPSSQGMWVQHPTQCLPPVPRPLWGGRSQLVAALRPGPQTLPSHHH